jgi:hypothetical protein
VKPTKIVVTDLKRDSGLVMLQLLAERIRQPRHARMRIRRVKLNLSTCEVQTRSIRGLPLTGTGTAHTISAGE